LFLNEIIQTINKSCIPTALQQTKKRMNKIAILATTLLIAFNAHSEEPSVTPVDGDLTPISLGEIISHHYYKLAYSETNEQALWVYYQLTPEMTSGNVSRTDNFREDPLISTGSANLKDYVGSGYDRGHLAPAASMSLNSTSMTESFYLSNMSPQHPSCNRGQWKSLEAQVRNWVNTEDTLYVVSGPLFKDNIGTIGTDKVTVPGYYYKVIYDPTDIKKMIAFIMPNAKMEKSIDNYVVTVDEVEQKTGIDFFSGINDLTENELESCSNFNEWNSEPMAINKSATTKTENHSTQCKGITKSTGKRCKNKTTNINGYCRLHQSQANN
jgi:endonuclease G